MRLLAIAGLCSVMVVMSACTSSGTVGVAVTGETSTPARVTSSTRPATLARSSTPPSPATASPATASPATPSPATPSTSAPSASGNNATGLAPTLAQQVWARMTEKQRVGQLIMVDCPSSGVAHATLAAIQNNDVGSVILDGNSGLGIARTRAITGVLQAAAPPHVRLFISTDQEGGLVQRMRGPGFSTIPSAVTQGTQQPVTLRTRWATWGRQLRAAGISVDLAPVLDTVAPNSTGNPPIGDLDREYGRTPAAVISHGIAAARGLADAGVDATVKHFPGLGRVSQNTDTTSGVTDPTTIRHGAYVAPFAAAVRNQVPFVMMSTAIYSRIDAKNPAAFSPTIVTGMLRGDLHFTGVIISDDIGSARQVSNVPPGQRAVSFVQAGGTIVLTVNPGVVAAMTSALLRRVSFRPGFRKQVDAAALVVLRAKQARGLLS